MKSTINKGRPKDDPVIRLRTLFWYWAVRNKSGLRDGVLDEIFSNLEPDGSKREYEDRIRMFEDIRKKGRKISNGEHYKRPFNLIDRVNDYPGLAGSREIYESVLWEILLDPNPSFENTRKMLLQMNALETLNQATFKLFEEPDSKEMQRLSNFTGFDEARLIEIMDIDIDSEFRNYYDSVFDSFDSLHLISKLGKKLDFQFFAGYLNQLAFSIVLYRYAMFTANFHALIASADFVKANLNFLELAQVNWIDPMICQEFFRHIRARVFMPSMRKPDVPLLTQLNGVNVGSSLEKTVRTFGVWGIMKEVNNKALFFILPSIMSALIFLMAMLSFYERTSFLIAFPILISTYVFALFYCFKMISQYLKRNYQVSASYTLGLLILIFVFGFPNHYFLNAAVAGNYLNVSLNKTQYLARAQKLKPNATGYRYLEIKDDANNPFIVYDESDEILQGENTKTSDFWRKYSSTKANGNVKECVAVIKKLKSHFYYVVTNDEVC